MSQKKHDLPSGADKLVATNRKARFQYHILNRYEAGIVLEGWEVKSLRTRGANFNDSFARVVIFFLSNLDRCSLINY